MKLAMGGKAAAAEAQRMVSEKIEAGLALQAKALSGGLGATALSVAAKTLDHYRPKVREPDTSCERRRSTAISTETKMANEVVTNALNHRARNYLIGVGNLGSRPCVDGPDVGKDFLKHLPALVGAAMCPAFSCGLSMRRWP